MKNDFSLFLTDRDSFQIETEDENYYFEIEVYKSGKIGVLIEYKKDGPLFRNKEIEGHIEFEEFEGTLPEVFETLKRKIKELIE